MKFNRIETFYFHDSFNYRDAIISPVHLRLERLLPNIPAHQHSVSSYEIHFCKSGQGILFIGSELKRYDIGTNTIFVTGPGIIHAQLSSEENPVLEYCLFLDCKPAEKKNSGHNLFLDTHFWIGQDSGKFSSILEQLFEENRYPKNDRQEICHILMQQFVILLTRSYREDRLQSLPSASHTLHSPASYISLIDDVFCYQCRALTLPTLSEMLNLSTRQTQRLLTKLYNKTFSQKLLEARMAQAVQLLVNTNLSITDISVQLGYSSLEYFSTVFNSYMACSPRDYRKSNGHHDRSTDATS